MKVRVYFQQGEESPISTVGMNNLFIINDARVKTKLGLMRMINRLVVQYHPAKRNKLYEVYDFDESNTKDTLWFRGISASTMEDLAK